MGDRQIHRLQQSCLSWTFDIDHRSHAHGARHHVLRNQTGIGQERSHAVLNAKFLPRDGVQVCQGFLAVVFASPAFFHIKDVAPGTVLRELQLLAHICTVAERDWGMHLPNGNPVEKIRKPAPGKARERALNDSERVKLLAECRKCKNPWVAPVVEFALETAARRGEILSLRWAEVNLSTATARVDGKTGTRTIPLSSRAVALLRDLPRSTSGVVFPVTIETLKQAYERAVARAGINDFTFHDLRHDALTRLAGLGLNILELRAISGHTTANMLQRYVRIDPSQLARKLA